MESSFLLLLSIYLEITCFEGDLFFFTPQYVVHEFTIQYMMFYNSPVFEEIVHLYVHFLGAFGGFLNWKLENLETQKLVSAVCWFAGTTVAGLMEKKSLF